MSFIEIKTCVCCGANINDIALDLGFTPPANSYLKFKEEKEEYFPLILNSCSNCGHLQLGHCVDPAKLFRNYIYQTGVGNTIKSYCSWFAEWAISLYKNKPKSILDIACNDGSQLDAFKKHGLETFGIDPAINLAEISSSNHRIISDFCSKDSLSQFNKEYFDIITAQNVVAHTCDPLQIMSAAHAFMNSDSIFLVQTSQADMLKYGQFDTIYHEHISFFSIDSMKILAAKANLRMVGYFKSYIHGGSHIFIFMKEDCAINISEIPCSEKRDKKTLEKFRIHANSVKKTFIEKTSLEIIKGKTLIGYGAAAKGINLLNYCDVNLHAIIDETPSKEGLFTPKMHIPIMGLNFLQHINIEKITWVILAWNCKEEIIKKINYICKESKANILEIGLESI